MRILTILFTAAWAFAQTPLIGVNSAAAELPAGARDVVASITVDPSPSGGDLFAVMLMAEGIQIHIELPDGRSITKESATSAGFTWDVESQGQGDAFLLPGLQGKVNHILVLPPKAPAGTYRVHADAGALKADSVVMLMFLPLGDSAGRAAARRDTVRVALMSPETFHYAGDKVKLLAGVFDGNRGVTDAQLTAVAAAVDEDGTPKGKPISVKFRLSGVGADGSYEADLPMTAVGKYEVALKVKGKYADGTEFERSAATDVTIEPRRAKILGVTERPVDKDGNGLVDEIEVTARVKAELAGEYALTVDLVAGSGKYMQGYGKAQLGIGDGNITATFPNFSLLHMEADGPYKINARLFRREGSGQAFASLLEDGGVTRAYKRSSFDRGPIYFAGTMDATPKSTAGLRPFDKLAVRLDVFTPGGDCQWHGMLQSALNQPVAFAQNSGKLPKGTAQIELAFDGFRIKNDADGKPLTLVDTWVVCGGAQAELEGQTSLPTFPANTFVQPHPAFELKLRGSDVTMKPGSAFTMILEIKPVDGFNQTVDLAMEGLPDGVVTQAFPPSLPSSAGFVMYRLAAGASASPGRYPVTVRAKYKTMERVQTFVIQINRW
jgi:hypothetical protein